MVVYTVDEVSSILKLPAETIRKYLRRGDLKGARIGRYWRIPEEELAAFIQKNLKKEKI